MSEGQVITHELTLREVISKTFQFYQREFTKYVILFVVLEAIIGVLNTLVQRAIVLPTLPPNATSRQLLNWAPGFFGALIELGVLTAILTLVFVPIAYGSAIKMASEEIVKGRSDLMESFRFAVSKLLWMWAVGIVVGIIVLLGLIALIIPGLILAIMFSLVLPVFVIEGSGFQSLERSRQLVSHRWLKTFVLLIVFGIIIVIASVIVNAISAPLGIASTIVSSILSAFYLPLIPISLTIYYYSNAARLAPPPVSPPPPMPPAVTVQPGIKFCPSCGTQLASTAMFCPSCGAKQSV